MSFFDFIEHVASLGQHLGLWRKPQFTAITIPASFIKRSDEITSLNYELIFRQWLGLGTSKSERLGVDMDVKLLAWLRPAH